MVTPGSTSAFSLTTVFTVVEADVPGRPFEDVPVVDQQRVVVAVELRGTALVEPSEQPDMRDRPEAGPISRVCGPGARVGNSPALSRPDPDFGCAT